MRGDTRIAGNGIRHSTKRPRPAGPDRGRSCAIGKNLGTALDWYPIVGYSSIQGSQPRGTPMTATATIEALADDIRNALDGFGVYDVRHYSGTDLPDDGEALDVRVLNCADDITTIMEVKPGPDSMSGQPTWSCVIDEPQPTRFIVPASLGAAGIIRRLAIDGFEPVELEEA